MQTFKLLVASLILLLSSAHAQLVNGDFKNDLDGWDITGGALPEVIPAGVLIDPGMAIRQEISGALKVGSEYELSTTAEASGQDLKLAVGVRFFDANWKGLLDAKIKTFSTGPRTSKISVVVPQGATRGFVYIRSYATASVNQRGLVRSVQFVLSESKRLRFAPPSLENPITLNVSTAFSALNLKDGQDYILKMPSTVKTGGLTIQGGRNVVVIGGHIRLDKSVNGASSDMQRRGVYIKNNSGVVHLEGLLIEGDGVATMDGIDIASPNSVVQVQNVRIVNIFGTHSGFHADLIQPFGGVKELLVDKFTGTSYYQGFQLASSSYTLGRVELHRVNVASLGNYSKDAGGQLFWLISSTQGFDCARSFPVVLDQFYLDPRVDGWGLGAAAYPMGSTKDSFGVVCGGQLNASKTEISFPLLPVTGVIKGGAPREGDFVPANVPGVSYISPGYR